MHQSNVPQCKIQSSSYIHISFLNGALWDMEQAHYICQFSRWQFHFDSPNDSLNSALSHFCWKISLHLCTKQALNLATSIYWFSQIVEKPVLSKVDFTVSTLLKWKVSCFSVRNLDVSPHRMEDMFPGFPNFRFSHKFVILVLIFVEMSKEPVSPYNIQFGWTWTFLINSLGNPGGKFQYR